MGTESAGMSGRGKWLAAVLLLAGAAPSIGSADAVTAVSSPLPDLITEALANNADVAAARSELEAARERGLDPSLAVSVFLFDQGWMFVHFCLSAGGQRARQLAQHLGSVLEGRAGAESFHRRVAFLAPQGGDPGQAAEDLLVHRQPGQLLALLRVQGPDVVVETRQGDAAGGVVHGRHQLAQHLGRVVHRAAKQVRVVVLVDALNQFFRTERSEALTWLPSLWPDNARLPFPKPKENSNCAQPIFQHPLFPVFCLQS